MIILIYDMNLTNQIAKICASFQLIGQTRAHTGHFVVHLSGVCTYKDVDKGVGMEG